MPPPPNPPPFQLPPSTPIPPMHPYNKLVPAQQPTTGVPPTSAPPGPSGPSARPPSTASTGLRPSYGLMTEREREAQREREKRDLPKQFSHHTPAARPTSESASHTVTGPHHHHHAAAGRPTHHHHAPGTSATPTVPPAPATGSIAGPARGYSSLNRLGSGYGIFGAGFAERERREREREREKEREREAKAMPPSVETSPNRSTTATFPRPSQPPSPTASRSVPTPPTSASTAGKPSVSPHMTTAQHRPNLPLPSLSTLAGIGTRSLPSPFERDARERSTSTSMQKSPAVTPSEPTRDTTHHRSASSSSSRGDASSGMTPANAQAPSPKGPAAPPIVRSLFSGPPPLAQTPRDSAQPARSPGDPAIPVNKPAQTPAASIQARAGYAYGNGYSSGFGGGYLASFGGPFGTYGNFGWADRERREREKRDRERAEARDKEERLKAEERDRERQAQLQAQADRDRRQAVGQEAKPFLPPRQGGSYSDPYRRQPNTTYEAKAIEPQGAGIRRPAEPDASALSQVAPSREPRPYTYTAKSDPAAAAAAAAKELSEREYKYTPRDTKRSRMDAAVEEAHRRGSVSKNKRRKEDTRSPIHAPSPRDWAALTREVKKWPEVRSSAVEAWLKTVADLSVVVGEEIYRGADWTLARTASTRSESEGGIVRVRINSAFLGSGWILRGERGWDEAALLPSKPTEITRRLEKSGAWGTDVYTDDSDLGLVLLHAGWLRWAREPTDAPLVNKPPPKSSEAMIVTIRVVPRLVHYTGRERNSVKTRNWGNGHDGRSIVVEGVQRITVTKKLLDRKISRKMRMTEYAQQRLAVLGLTVRRRTLKEDDDTSDEVERDGQIGDEEPGLMWTNDGAVLRYCPDAFRDEMSLTMDEEAETKNISTHDLYLVSTVNSEKYLLEYSDTGLACPVVLRLTQLEPTRKVVADDLTVEQVVWVPEGLVVRLDGSEGKEGLLCPIDGYLWKRRQAS